MAGRLQEPGAAPGRASEHLTAPLSPHPTRRRTGTLLAALPWAAEHGWWVQIPYLNGLLLAQSMDLDQVLAMLHKIEAHTRRVQSLVEAGEMRQVNLNFGDCGFYLG